MKSIKAIFRRGQKLDGQLDNLSRTSSSTTLDSDQRSNKGVRSKKESSRERVDRAFDHKSDKKTPPKLEAEEDSYPSIDSIQEEEFNQLRRQLQEMSQERANLAYQLSEQKGQLKMLQSEIQILKSSQEDSNVQIEHLTEENTTLRNRLRDVVHSPLSDNEKQQLLFESQRYHNSAPSSIAVTVDPPGINETTYISTSSEWDKHSSSNASEVSVACLQDKINQMQETHYSTNEELQATLQELTDLQRQITELQQENERLNDEKTLMFDSLCRQTERLNDSRSKVESLKQLLYQEKEDEDNFEPAAEQEQTLVDLLKSIQEEREELLLKIEQVGGDLTLAENRLKEKDEQMMKIQERVKTLECTLDAKHAEQKLLEQDLVEARHQCNGKQIEINRLTDLLDSARAKITELEQDRALSDKSELDELLDLSRKEKDSLESEVSHLKEQLALNKNEIDKLREQVYTLQEECKVTRNNAKTIQSDLEYKCERLQNEKSTLNAQIQEYQEALNELQVQSQCQLEDKRQLSTVLSETQRNLSETERKNLNLLSEIDDLKKMRSEENEEWEKFQNDLLTSVRVANDFKTEAQQELQRMIMENKTYRDRERQLRAEIEKLKGEGRPNQPRVMVGKQEEKHSTVDFLMKRPKPKRDSSIVTKRYSQEIKPTNEKHSVVDFFSKKQNKDVLDQKEKVRSVTKVKGPDEKPVETRLSHLFLTKSEEKLRKDVKVPEKLVKKPISVDIVDGDEKKVKKPKEFDSKIPKRAKNIEPGALKKYLTTLQDDKKPTKPNEQPETKPPKKLQFKHDQTEHETKTDLKKTNEIEHESKLAKRKRKSLSAEEQILLKHLEESYEIIDKTLPDDRITEAERAIITLKQLFDDENLRLKPIAKKPKEQLAISKPLLDSVMNNPKLRIIISDPNIISTDKVPVTDLDAVDAEPQNESTGFPTQSYRLYRSKEVDDLTKDLPMMVRKSRSSSLSSLTGSGFSFIGHEEKNNVHFQRPTWSISLPTLNSAEGNHQLKTVLRDSRRAPKRAERVIKSYSDITFTFHKISPASSESLSGAEFNLDTGLTGPYSSKIFENSNLTMILTDERPVEKDSGNVLVRSISNNFKDDLMYNDTLVKNRTSESFEEKGIIECKNENVAVVPTTSKANEPNEEISTSLIKPTEEIATSPIKPTEEISTSFIEPTDDEVWNSLDDIESSDEDSEYNYKHILKENRFGVTSPLNLRLSYKNVVKEIKDTVKEIDVIDHANTIEPSAPKNNFAIKKCGHCQKNNETGECELTKFKVCFESGGKPNETLDSKFEDGQTSDKVVEMITEIKSDEATEHSEGNYKLESVETKQLSDSDTEVQNILELKRESFENPQDFKSVEMTGIISQDTIKPADSDKITADKSTVLVESPKHPEQLLDTFVDSNETPGDEMEQSKHNPPDVVPQRRRKRTRGSDSRDLDSLRDILDAIESEANDLQEMVKKSEERENPKVVEIHEKSSVQTVGADEHDNRQDEDSSQITLEEIIPTFFVMQEPHPHNMKFTEPSSEIKLAETSNQVASEETIYTSSVIQETYQSDTSVMSFSEITSEENQVKDSNQLAFEETIPAFSAIEKIYPTNVSSFSEGLTKDNQNIPEVTLRKHDGTLKESRITIMTSHNIPAHTEPPNSSTLLNRESRDSATFTSQHMTQRQSYPTMDRMLLRKNQKVKQFAKHFERLSVEKAKRKEALQKPTPPPRRKHQIGESVMRSQTDMTRKE